MIAFNFPLGLRMIWRSPYMPHILFYQIIIELIRNRHREKRREEILRNAQQTFEEHKKGLTSKGTVAQLLQELEE